MFESAGLEVLQLSNNLNVIYQPLPTAVVVADVWVSAGSAMETEENTGVAHFLEHMIFKGTSTLAPGMFDRLIEDQGGVTNAATSYDYTHFFVATGVEQFQPCLAALAHILLEASLCPLELEGERQVVLAEINQVLDNPGALSWQYFNEQLYPAHPYGRSILGSIEQVQAHSNHDLKAFHCTYYQPENLTIVVAGGIEKAHCLHHIQHAFDVFPTPLDRIQPHPLTAPITPPEALQIQPQRSEHQLPLLDQTTLMLGWPTPAIDRLRDICGLEVLSVVLTGGRLSSLVQILREQRRVIQDVCSELELRKAASRFTISTWLEEPYVAMVESLILNELRRIRHEGLKEWEVQRAKRLLLNDITFSLETPLQISRLYGFYNILQNPYTPLHYPRQIQQLTATDLQEIAQTYLTDDNYVVTIARPA